MNSTYRDRTAEFRSVTETLKKIGGGGIRAVDQADNGPSPSSSKTSRSEFNRKASFIGLGIHEASKKIARLAKLAKRSSMFDDPTVEIQELTALVKKEITALNGALTDLQTVQNMEVTNGNYSEDRMVHSTTVCDDLKNKLMGATKELQGVLTARTENIKAHENRRQLFSKSASRENPFQKNPKLINEPPPWSNMSNASQSAQQSEVPSNGVQAGNQLRRRLAPEATPSSQMEMSMLQQVAPRQENYTQSRAVALQSVESTITELGGIFTNLATMVAHQGELAIRFATTIYVSAGLPFLILEVSDMIDDNMDESLANVEGAHSSLLKYLHRISSNRWLMIKIFAIIIFFLMIFIFFIA